MAEIPEPYHELAEAARALLLALGRGQKLTFDEEERVERALEAVSYPLPARRD